MDQDTATHLVLTLGAAVVSGTFTAGGILMYVRMSISHLEEWGKENHEALNEKIDKNFETLDCKLGEVHRELLADLSGIGSKVGFNERQASRRYHNLTAAVMLAAPVDKENEVSRLLKEEAS